ncbi:MAG TPA: methyltransferase domain-containing protein [Syntrophales bacterium]|nr:methyltransferase domain-containing protein [Syntrophales bacterium]HPC33775.1 methyltransferase domain-containing protein [Syntrophales bacterium]
MKETRNRDDRAEREVRHGRKLVAAGPEEIWGWDTAAGRMRARRRGELISRKAGLRFGMHVLEIGCGTGLFTEIFAESGVSILAVDISEDLLQKALSRNLPAERVRFLAVPFEDPNICGPFDAVIGSSVLHHLEIVPALTRIFRLLSPGGVMVFAEPNMLNPQIMIQKNIPWLKARLGDSPDETAFIASRLSRRLVRCGFTEVEILPFDWLHPLTPPGLIKTVMSWGAFLEKLPFVRHFAGSLLIAARRPIGNHEQA